MNHLYSQTDFKETISPAQWPVRNRTDVAGQGPDYYHAIYEAYENRVQLFYSLGEKSLGHGRPWYRTWRGGGLGLGWLRSVDFLRVGPGWGTPDCDRLAQEYNIRAHPISGDVGDPRSARAFVHEAARLMGGLDIAICNAGICDFKPILEVTDEDWLRHVSTNLNGSFYVAQESAKILVEQKAGGRIIFTSSVGAFRSNSTQTHYCATKGGRHLLMQGMALELGPHQITVNSVAPGWIHTDINDAASRDPSITGPWIKAHAPVGRLGTVEDIKAAFLFLASRGASYVNGSSIVVDGGWSAQL